MRYSGGHRARLELLRGDAFGPFLLLVVLSLCFGLSLRRRRPLLARTAARPRARGRRTHVYRRRGRVG